MPARLTKEKWRRIPIYCRPKNTFAKKGSFSADGFSALTRHGKNRYTEEKENGECPLFSPFSHRGTTYGFPEKKGKALESINFWVGRRRWRGRERTGLRRWILSLSLSLWREGIGLGGFGRTCYFSSPVFLRGKISPERIPEEAIGIFYFLSFFAGVRWWEEGANFQRKKMGNSFAANNKGWYELFNYFT